MDPNGPAGQQYALPIDSVRAESAGNPLAGVPGASTPPPLFGQGIRPEGESESPVITDSNGSGPSEESVGSGPGGTSGGYGLDGKKGMESDPTVKAIINGTGGGSSTAIEVILLISGLALVGLTAGLIGRKTL